MKRALNILGRFALTGTVIAGIGFGFVALNPPDENGEIGVQESSADIFSMSLADRTSTQKLQSALERLGHEKPRVYDYNGNTVMFSTSVRPGNLDDTLRDYMQTFADEGVNPIVFDYGIEAGSEAHKKMLEASISGGVAPVMMDDKYLLMTGAVLDIKRPGEDPMRRSAAKQDATLEANLDRYEEAYKHCGGDMKAYRNAIMNPDPKSALPQQFRQEKVMTKLCEGSKPFENGSCDDTIYRRKMNVNRYKALTQMVENNEELLSCGPLRNAITAMSGARYDDFTDKLKAYRSIEAFYDKKTNSTRVMASWSDETFDARKAQPSRYGGVIDTDAANKIPLCPNCRRTYAFGGTGKERGYQANMVISPQDPARTAHFYADRMAQDGWETPETEIVVDELLRMSGKQDPNDQWLRMRKGDENLALHFSRNDEGQTIVQTHTAP